MFQWINDRFFWRFVDVIRALPLARGKMRLFNELLASAAASRSEHRFDSSCGVSLKWSSRGLPDLLTRHMLLQGGYQEDVLASLIYLVHPGDVVFDIGAHHGLMSVVSSLRVGSTGKVVAFEPNDSVHPLFRYFVELNGVEDIVMLEPCGVADVEAKWPFFAREDAFAWNSSFERRFADPEEQLVPRFVSVTTIDTSVTRLGLKPSVIKIDTEGTEFKVLRGGERTLRTYRPRLILELNSASAKASGHTLSDEVEFLESLDYLIYLLPSRGLSNDSSPYILTTHFQAAHCPEDSLVNVVCVGKDDPDLATLAGRGMTAPPVHR